MTAPAPEPGGRWRTGSIAVTEPTRSRGTTRGCAGVAAACAAGTGWTGGGPSSYVPVDAAAGTGAYCGDSA